VQQLQPSDTEETRIIVTLGDLRSSAFAGINNLDGSAISAEINGRKQSSRATTYYQTVQHCYIPSP
jgi:hypothetical protein